jgi:taurine dioxygenase
MECSITPLSGHAGAEIGGVDLGRPIDEHLRAQLNRVFVDRSILVFRDQHLTPHQLVVAVRLFGDVFTQHSSTVAFGGRRAFELSVWNPSPGM